MIYASFRFDDLYFHLIAKLSENLPDIFPYFFVYYLSAVLWCKYDMIFAPIAGMRGMFYLILHR